MVSQVEETFCFDNIVLGHHAYKTVWTLFLGEILTATPEPKNGHDRQYCVCVQNAGEIVGHVPNELLQTVWPFLCMEDG